MSQCKAFPLHPFVQRNKNRLVEVKMAANVEHSLKRLEHTFGAVRDMHQLLLRRFVETGVGQRLAAAADGSTSLLSDTLRLRNELLRDLDFVDDNSDDDGDDRGSEDDGAEIVADEASGSSRHPGAMFAEPFTEEIPLRVLRRTRLVSTALTSQACAVCQDDFFYGQSAVMFSCRHFFCETCVLPWLAICGSCPTCRHVIGPEDFADDCDQPRPISMRDIDSSPTRCSTTSSNEIVVPRVVVLSSNKAQDSANTVRKNEHPVLAAPGGRIRPSSAGPSTANCALALNTRPRVPLPTSHFFCARATVVPLCIVPSGHRNTVQACAIDVPKSATETCAQKGPTDEHPSPFGLTAPFAMLTTQSAAVNGTVAVKSLRRPSSGAPRQSATEVEALRPPSSSNCGQTLRPNSAQLATIHAILAKPAVGRVADRAPPASAEATSFKSCVLPRPRLASATIRRVQPMAAERLHSASTFSQHVHSFNIVGSKLSKPTNPVSSKRFSF